MKSNVQPYQVFFPMGLFYGLWGVLVWPVFALRGGEFPAILHAGLMVNGFLLCFAAGFLLTAVPKFTGSEAAKPWEIGVAAVLSLWPVLIPLTGISPLLLSSGAAVAACLFLLFFFIGRRKGGKFNPPEHFDFVALGLSFGILGGLGLVLRGFGFELFPAPGASSALLYQGMMLSLIVGIGARLVTALLGWNESHRVQLSRNIHAPKPRVSEPRLQMIGLAAGFALEAFGFDVPGRFVRAGVVTWIAVRHWKIHKRPRNVGRLPTWLWISAWGVVAGLWVHVVLPGFGVHALHAALVAGISWMVLVVASRVTLAHGGYDLALERDSRGILFAGIAILLAAATRVTAPLIPQTYFNHLAYAGGLWALGVLIWGFVFVPRIFLWRGGRDTPLAR